jgi:hypothetical protein
MQRRHDHAQTIVMRTHDIGTELVGVNACVVKRLDCAGLVGAVGQSGEFWALDEAPPRAASAQDEHG